MEPRSFLYIFQGRKFKGNDLNSLQIFRANDSLIHSVPCVAPHPTSSKGFIRLCGSFIYSKSLSDVAQRILLLLQGNILSFYFI